MNGVINMRLVLLVGIVLISLASIVSQPPGEAADADRQEHRGEPARSAQSPSDPVPGDAERLAVMR